MKSSNIFGTPSKGGKIPPKVESALNSGSKLEIEECSNISDISYGNIQQRKKSEFVGEKKI